MTTVTFPPELLPSPAEGDEAEVVVIHPDTKVATTVLVVSGEDEDATTADLLPVCSESVGSVN